MMKKFLLPFSALISLLIVGCVGNKTMVTENDLIHHRFELISVDGKEVPQFKEKPIVIEFGEKMYVSGTMCNQFFGNATLSHGVLTSKGLASTRMLCSSDLRNQLDVIIGKLFSEGAKVELIDGLLTLQSKEHSLTYKIKDLVN